MRESGVDVNRRQVSYALRDRLHGDVRLSRLITSLSLLPALVKAIRESLPDCFVELATKPLPLGVSVALTPMTCTHARAFQHLFLCEGDFVRAFQAASEHCNVEVDATFVSEDLVGFPYHIYLLVQKG